MTSSAGGSACDASTALLWLWLLSCLLIVAIVHEGVDVAKVLELLVLRSG